MNPATIIQCECGRTYTMHKTAEAGKSELTSADDVRDLVKRMESIRRSSDMAAPPRSEWVMPQPVATEVADELDRVQFELAVMRWPDHKPISKGMVDAGIESLSIAPLRVGATKSEVVCEIFRAMMKAAPT